ncbi:hypothetical protein AB0L65_33315 [Nonomuraea sp. NPDC052116]|uniref:hypothetical protein n=1 Tax=Nonomuraea sp. NPDC052116 TaxID=3155665 RepID=UPI0034254690
MIRIVKASTLTALQQAAGESAQLREDLTATKRMVAAYKQELGIALEDIERCQAVHEDVRQQARDWEAQYHAVADGIGKWVGQVRAKVEDPVARTEFQGDLALGLWRAYLDKAEAEGEDAFTVRLLRTLLGLGAPAEDAEGSTR